MENGIRRIGEVGMKIIKHGKLLRFVCENCECEWQEVKKNCEDEVIQEPYSHRYWYRCPECGKNTKGYEVKAEDILQEGR